MPDDILARAEQAMQGVTEGHWMPAVAPGDNDETPAEWMANALAPESTEIHVVWVQGSSDPVVIPAITGDGPCSRQNAAFIAAARTLVPELVAELREARMETKQQAFEHGEAWAKEYTAARQAEAERDEARELAGRLHGWKIEAMPVLAGLQDLGQALGVPLGHAITGPESVERVQRLIAERDEARAAIARVRALTVFAEASSDELRRALDGDA